MVGSRAILLAFAAVQTAVAASVQPKWLRDVEVKERHPTPRRWTRLDRAPRDHVIDLQIGIKQGNFVELERHLYEVSDPDHERYGQHLSVHQVNELVQPSDETLELVHEWLSGHGVTPSGYSSAKDWVTVSLPVEVVERLLDTEYHTYEHEDGERVVRTSQWSLPAHLHGHVDTIQPTTSFFRLRPNKYDHNDAPVWVPPGYQPPSNATLNKVCNISSVTPQCFETLYNINYKTRAADKNSVAFNNFLGEHPIRTDGALFLTKYRPEAVSSAYKFPQLTIADGPGDSNLTADDLASGTSKEANLDFQAIAGISWATPIISYSTGGSPPFNPSVGTPDNSNEPYLVWVNWLLSQPHIPPVISTSYGDEEWTVPESYARRVCQQFAQVGARGTSLLFASGDNGVGTVGTCVSNDGKGKFQFVPSFPASCPFVTTVGATMDFAPEVVAYRPAFVDAHNVSHGNYTSGGGFSLYFDTPSYQQQEVRSYVKSLKGLYHGYFNPNGRGYPDVSAQGLYFAYFWNGTEGTISGTSASTPLFSGILSLVNDALLANRKSPLGFLNPWLYKQGYKALNDIKSGSAHGCDLDGFPATEGWDPVTGLGTPNFPELVKLTGGRL